MLLVAAGVLLVVVVAVRRSRQPSPDPAPRSSAVSTPTAGRLAEDLRRWTGAGLLSGDQAAAILAWDASRAPADPTPASPPAARSGRRAPAVAEALAYLGGLLVVTGLVLIVAHYWPDMAGGWRLSLSAVAAVGLTAAGALLPAGEPTADRALPRARGFLWLASSAAAALCAGVLVADVLAVDSAETVVLAAAVAVALHSGLLWQGRPSPLQQLACLVGATVALGAAVAEIAALGVVGVAVGAAGAALIVLGLRRRTPLPLLTDGVGACAVVVGSVMAAGDWEGPGLLLAAASALGLLTLALVPGPAPTHAEQVELGAVGGFLLLQILPGVLGYYSRDAGLAAGAVTWAAGGALLVVGRRRLVRLPEVVEVLGAAAMIGGAALTGVQAGGFAPLFGIATGIALVALGTLAGNGDVLVSAAGAAALLGDVPWAIAHFFPGQGQAPLLIMVSGMLIIAIAVLLTRRPLHP